MYLSQRKVPPQNFMAVVVKAEIRIKVQCLVLTVTKVRAVYETSRFDYRK